MPVNHGVPVHVLMRSVGGRKENRMQRESFELLGGCPFLSVKRPRCRTQKGTPYGVGVHVDETGTAEEECDRKREIARNDVTH